MFRIRAGMPARRRSHALWDRDTTDALLLPRHRSTALKSASASTHASAMPAVAETHSWACTDERCRADPLRSAALLVDWEHRTRTSRTRAARGGRAEGSADVVGWSSELVGSACALGAQAAAGSRLAHCCCRSQATLLGSVLSNLLLVLGTAFFVGGIRHHDQQYSPSPFLLPLPPPRCCSARSGTAINLGLDYLILLPLSSPRLVHHARPMRAFPPL